MTSVVTFCECPSDWVKLCPQQVLESVSACVRACYVGNDSLHSVLIFGIWLESGSPCQTMSLVCKSSKEVFKCSLISGHGPCVWSNVVGCCGTCYTAFTHTPRWSEQVSKTVLSTDSIIAANMPMVANVKDPSNTTVQQLLLCTGRPGSGFVIKTQLNVT